MTVENIIWRIFVILLAITLSLALATQGLLRAAGFSKTIDNGSTISDMFFGPTGDLAAIYNRQSFNSDKSHIIFIGASNVILIHAPVVQKSLGNSTSLANYNVANISVQGTGLPGFRRQIDLAYDAMPAHRRGHNIFVIGLWYGLFCSSHKAPLEDAFETQLTRTNLYVTSPNGETHPRFGRSATTWALFGLQPFILIYRNFQTASDFGRTLMSAMATGHVGKISASDNIKNGVSMTALQKQAALQLRTQWADNVHTAGFVYVREIAQKILNNGDQLVLVNVPLPKWHRDGVAAYNRFQAQSFSEYNKISAIKGVRYINLENALTDNEFSDSIHPKPAAADRLANIVAMRLSAGH